MSEPDLTTKNSIAQYIANNLIRMSRSGDNQKALTLMTAAASLLATGDDPQTMSAVKRLVQLAISQRGKS